MRVSLSHFLKEGGLFYSVAKLTRSREEASDRASSSFSFHYHLKGYNKLKVFLFFGSLAVRVDGGQSGARALLSRSTWKDNQQLLCV